VFYCRRVGRRRLRWDHRTINVNAPDEGTNVAYSDVVILDAKDDPDINQYADKIKSSTINSIGYQITSYDGPADAKFSGTLAFGGAPQSTAAVFSAVADFDFQAAYSSGEIFGLTFSQSDITTIQNFLQNEKAVKFYLDGTLTKTPLYCTVKIYLEVSVTAYALQFIG
jgi:hypothetical protein